jgi:hypothetical protein
VTKTRFLVLRLNDDKGYRLCCCICFARLWPFTWAWRDDKWFYCRDHKDREGVVGRTA